MAFFVAVTAIMAVSIYVQRTLQARERDAKIYMVDMMAQGCVDVDVSQGTTDCQGAAGMNAGKMAYEYEPYYVQVNSIVERDSAETKALTGPGIFTKSDSSQTQAQSQSNQISPVYAK